MFGAETWVLTLMMERDLDSFQHRFTKDHWEATAETGGWELGVPDFSGGNGGSGLRGDQKV